MDKERDRQRKRDGDEREKKKESDRHSRIQTESLYDIRRIERETERDKE